MQNLVQDVYKVLEDGAKLSSNEINELAQNLANTIAKRLTVRDKRKFTIRFSNIGLPVRKLYMDYKYPAEVQHDGQTLLKFLYGDIIEELVIFLIKKAGYDVQDEQKEVRIGKVKGHLDCTINGQVTDVKSTSDYSFIKFSRHQLSDIEKDTFGYLGQISGYVQAYHDTSHTDNTHSGSFIAINKATGAIVVDTYSDLELIDAEEKINNVIEALKKDEPPEEYCYENTTEENGNVKLNKNCSYCFHKKRCYPELRTFKYATGLVDFAKVVKELRVEEIK